MPRRARQRRAWVALLAWVGVLFSSGVVLGLGFEAGRYIGRADPDNPVAVLERWMHEVAGFLSG